MNRQEDTEENTGQMERGQKSRLPVDRGWAWVVLAACFGELFIIVGSLKSFGLFFVEFLEAYDTTASMVSISLSIQTATFSFAAFFVMTLGYKRFTSRQLIMTGGFLAALGYLLNAYAPTVTFLIFSHGLMNGTGLAMSYGPAVVLLSTYFERWKGLANSLANVGGSLGSLVFPLLIRYLLDTYGLRGSLMICSGTILNLVVMGSLMRPFPVTSEERDRLIKVEEIDISLDVVEVKEQCNGKVNEHEKMLDKGNTPQTDNNQKCNGASDVTTTEHSQMLGEKLYTQISHQSDNSRNGNLVYKLGHSNVSLNKVLGKLSSSIPDVHGSMGNLHAPVSVVNITTSTHSIKDSISSEKHIPCYQTFFNCSVLKNHRFQIIMIGGFCVVFGSALAITFIPPFAKDCNVPDDKIALLITIAAVSDFVGRFSVAWLADAGIIRRQNLIGLGMMISGIGAMCNHLYNSFESFAAYAAVYGLFGGIYFSLYPVLIVDAVGQKNLSDGLAVIFMVHGLSLMMNSFLIGFIRDLTGSYHASFYLMGSGLLLGAMFFFCDNIVRRMEDNEQKRSEK